jgi:hypothetical protein
MKKTKTNYMHIVPNSHFWTDLNQLLEHLKYQEITKEYLKIGLENTLKQGYNLKEIKKKKK